MIGSFNFDGNIYITSEFFVDSARANGSETNIRTLVHEFGRLYGDQRGTDTSGEDGDVYRWDLIVRGIWKYRDEIEECCKNCGD